MLLQYHHAHEMVLVEHRDEAIKQIEPTHPTAMFSFHGITLFAQS